MAAFFFLQGNWFLDMAVRFNPFRKMAEKWRLRKQQKKQRSEDLAELKRLLEKREKPRSSFAASWRVAFEGSLRISPSGPEQRRLAREQLARVEAEGRPRIDALTVQITGLQNKLGLSPKEKTRRK